METISARNTIQIKKSKQINKHVTTKRRHLFYAKSL